MSHKKFNKFSKLNPLKTTALFYLFSWNLLSEFPLLWFLSKNLSITACNTGISIPELVSFHTRDSSQFPGVNRILVCSLNIYYIPSACDKPQHTRLLRLMGWHHMGLHIEHIHLAQRCVCVCVSLSFKSFVWFCFVLFLMKCIDVLTWQTSPLNSLPSPIH